MFLPEDVALNLQIQAETRGVSQAELAAALLDAIARDNLYDAVIDGRSEPKRNKVPLATRRNNRG